MNQVFKNNEFIGWVDRTYEDHGDNSEIAVELPCGFEISFWLTGLTDEEYINRAKMIKQKS